MHIGFEEEYDLAEINERCTDLYLEQDGMCAVCGEFISSDLMIAKIDNKPCCIHRDCLGIEIIEEVLTFPISYVKFVQNSLEENHVYAEEISGIEELIDLFQTVDRIK